MPITPTEYERATAIVTHATLKVSIDRSYPELSPEDRDALIVGVIDRMARMRGWAIRREFVLSEDEGE
jgi:hypothetical protein